MFDKFVRPADAFNGDGAICFLQRFEHCATESAGDHVVLHRHEERNTSGVAEQKGAVERFDETGVHDTDGKIFLGGQAFGEFKRVLHHAAKGPNHDIGSFPKDFSVPDRKRGGLRFDWDSGACTTRITDEAGAGELKACVKHVDEFVLISRLHDRRVRHAAKIREVEKAVVRGPIVGREAGAIHAKCDREILQCDVVNDLVVGALKKCRINGANGTETFRGKAGREQYGVLLGNTDVEELPRHS